MTNISKNAEMPQCDKTAVMHSNLSLADKIELEIAKIFFLANQINRKTEMCCFANDVAHCNYVEIKLHKTKKDYNGVAVVFELKYDVSGGYEWNIDSQERLDKAKKCVEFLEKTLNDLKIDYSIVYAVKEYVVTSYEI